MEKIVTTHVYCHKACPGATLLGYGIVVITFSRILYQITTLQSQVWARGTKPQGL